MNFQLPPDLIQFIKDIDAFIEKEIVPLQKQDDNDRFFDYRREWARTDFENGGLPRKEWEQLLVEAKNRADKAGFFRFHLPKRYGGEQSDGADGRGSNLWMAVIREHLASKGLGLFNDLQNEHSVVGNFPDVVMVENFGTEEQKEELIGGRLKGKVRITFGLTEPLHVRRRCNILVLMLVAMLTSGRVLMPPTWQPTPSQRPEMASKDG